MPGMTESPLTKMKGLRPECEGDIFSRGVVCLDHYGEAVCSLTDPPKSQTVL